VNPNLSPRSPHPRDLTWLLAVWFLLAIVMVSLAKQNLSVPGLYYDEAVFAGMAKDFVTGQVHGAHMPDTETVKLLGRPFPVFIQTYLGALKSWMLIPAFQIFGSSMSVLRSTELLWALIALLFFMLGTRRWLGMPAALIAGPLLALDPTYFFLGVLDWGAAVPSFLCRCVAFYLAVLSWRSRQSRYAFLAGAFAGLGFFNKIDFAVFLIGVGVAGLCCYSKQILALFRARSSAAALCSLGFLIGAGPMLLKVPQILMLAVSGPHPNTVGELSTKLHVMMSMLDGSYFHRLMSAGGLFEKMYELSAATRTGFGLALFIACSAFIALKMRRKQSDSKGRAITFLILTTLLITLGVILLPGAVRIHHAVLVFPLPQLIVGVAVAALWEKLPRSAILELLKRALICAGILALLFSQLRAISKTEQVIRETGGRGPWSESLNAFCREIRNRSDLTIASLDWGFNEQLMLLTDGPRLEEPFWNFNRTLPPLPADAHYIFLVHPPEYSVLKYDVVYLNAIRSSGQNVDVRPYFDRQNQVAFYTIQFQPR
jgi:dolichyl-phosphate-mannose-protein mannosyltransferase